MVLSVYILSYFQFVYQSYRLACMSRIITHHVTNLQQFYSQGILCLSIHDRHHSNLLYRKSCH
jgi:hypothetical protein